MVSNLCLIEKKFWWLNWSARISCLFRPYIYTECIRYFPFFNYLNLCLSLLIGDILLFGVTGKQSVCRRLKIGQPQLAAILLRWDLKKIVLGIFGHSLVIGFWIQLYFEKKLVESYWNLAPFLLEASTASTASRCYFF